MFNKFDFKYIIKRVLIGLAIAFILFNINRCNANALIRKFNAGDNPSFVSRSQSGSITSGSYSPITFTLNSNFTINKDYDLIGIQLTYFDFRYNENFSLDNPYLAGFSGTDYITCVLWENQNTCKQWTLSDPNTTFPSSLYGTVQNGSLYSFYALAWDDNNRNTPIFFTSDYQNVLFFSTSDIDNLHHITFYVRNHASSNLQYFIELDNIKSYFNYDSTEIVNGLGGIQQQQQQTNDIITDPSTSQSTTSGQNFITNGQSAISSKFEDATSYNQFTGILNNFLGQMSNATCQPINLPIPYTEETLVLPCLGNEFTQKIPALWTLYKLIITGALGIVLWKYFIGFVKGIMDPYNIGATNLPIGGGK